MRIYEKCPSEEYGKRVFAIYVILDIAPERPWQRLPRMQENRKQNAVIATEPDGHYQRQIQLSACSKPSGVHAATISANSSELSSCGQQLHSAMLCLVTALGH